MKLPYRSSKSHKGQNGRVLVVGGNELFYGAPLLAALGGEKSGVDLVTLFLPKAHQEIAMFASYNFFIHPFSEEYLRREDVQKCFDLIAQQDVVILGNGLGKNKNSQQALLEILSQIAIPVVLDAEALFPEILQIERRSKWILTPHEGEFQRLFGVSGSRKNIQKMAQKHNICMVKKGSHDIIANPHGKMYVNTTGTAQMSVGGTGDALAGIIGGFIAQGLSAFEAATSATFLWGKCGEKLSKTQASLTAQEMLNIFPQIRKGYA